MPLPPARLALYVGAATLLGESAYSLFARPLAYGWLAGTLGCYLPFVVAGATVLRWRAFVDAVVAGPPGARGVALTFDDGPDPDWTARVLALLAERHVRATFFLIGRKAEEHPDVVRAIVAQGHDVGLHSYAHDRFFALRREHRIQQDLERGISALERITGRRPVLFRPPIGHTNPAIARTAHALDLTVVGWSVSGRDGLATARGDSVARRVCGGLRDGAIVLLHDARERSHGEPAGARALPVVLDAIARLGLETVPLSEWIPTRQPSARGKTT